MAVSGESSGPWAAGIVICDPAAGCRLNETGRKLEAAGDERAAHYQALLAGLQAAAAMSPEELEIRCVRHELVQRITGDPGAGVEEDELHQQVMMQLLRFDIWRIVAVDAGELKRPLELAGQALGLSSQQIAQAMPAAKAPIGPRWTVQLMEEPGRDCPAGCREGVAYEMSATVPAGLCIHAARAALIDGPLGWKSAEQSRMTTYCDHCDVPLQITRL